MKTFADKAKSIMNKYPNHKEVSVDQESMADELSALAKEQEEFKKENSIGQDNQKAMEGQAQVQFAMGGMTNSYGDGGPTYDEHTDNYLETLRKGSLAHQFTPKAEDWESTDEGQDAILAELDEDKGYFESLDRQNKESAATQDVIAGEAITEGVAEEDARLEASLNKHLGIKQSKVGRGVDKVMQWSKDNSDMLLNSASGASAIIANIINRNSVKDPRLVQTDQVNPINTTRHFDPTSLDRGVSNDLASSLHTLSNRGGDLQALLQGVNSVNSASATARGKITTNAQMHNFEVDKNRDANVNMANLANTKANNQAYIDLVQRQDDTADIKREYTAGIGANMQGMFKDMADSQLAKKLSPYYEALAKIQGNKVAQ